MTVAALYDVHGNVYALEAVLADGAGDADAVVFGGDLVLGAWPRETLALARSLGLQAHLVRGNWERLLADGSTSQPEAWVRERLDGADLGWPPSVTLDGVLYVHATPRRDDEVVVPGLERGWDAFDEVQERVVVCGHSHVQFDVVRNGRRIVNPGSVGNPTVRPTAWWALLDGEEVELRTTDYDTESVASAMAATGWQWLDFVDELRSPYSLEQVLEHVR